MWSHHCVCEYASRRSLHRIFSWLSFHCCILFLNTNIELFKGDRITTTCGRYFVYEMKRITSWNTCLCRIISKKINENEINIEYLLCWWTLSCFRCVSNLNKWNDNRSKCRIHTELFLIELRQEERMKRENHLNQSKWKPLIRSPPGRIEYNFYGNYARVCVSEWLSVFNITFVDLFKWTN